ncbi:hypothetical protein CN1A_63 [Clavibacter phage CN1A]|uniref:Uncharacterized protein n=1 Tax=Clavibacter phage CN1A TaxID=1406793 RepID=U5PX53_9CAUD|nr:hypothetical protein CN1A_63 [Clavibacter phage CN1A]AGY47172.1 hypothetical protein CN1A_63 [Clavibacter phage CN1A]
MNTLLSAIDNDISDMYRAGVGNGDSRMIYAWRQFDALIEKEDTHD